MKEYQKKEREEVGDERKKRRVKRKNIWVEKKEAVEVEGKIKNRR